MTIATDARLARSRNTTPKLVVADGALSLWSALPHVWPTAKEPRCWNHKNWNVVDKLPEKLQAEAKELLTKIPHAPIRAEACDQVKAFRKRSGRLRTDAAKRFKNVANATAMSWRGLCVAQKKFRRLELWMFPSSP